MAKKIRTSRFSLFQFIIALVFVGYAANSMGWTEQYLGYAKTLFWKPVSVELTGLAIDAKAKTGVTAEYQYRYSGQLYTSQKIRAVDKNWLDSDQALEIYTSLRSQRNSGKVQGWLNPEQPKQVVLDRNILHIDNLPSSIFTLAFLAMPLLMVLLPLLFRRKKKIEPELTVEERAEIHQKKVVDLTEQSVIASEQKGNYQLYLKISIGLLIFTLLLTAPALIEVFEGNIKALIALIFPAVTGGLLLHALSKRKHYLKIGPTLLTPEPLPGCIGGQVGGSFNIAGGRFRDSVKLTLTCVQSYSSGSGDNRTTHRNELWQQTTKGFIKAAKGLSSDKTEICFVYNLPKNLPQTGEYQKGAGDIEWELKAQGMYFPKNEKHFTEFNRSWILPVIEPLVSAVAGSDQPLLETITSLETKTEEISPKTLGGLIKQQVGDKSEQQNSLDIPQAFLDQASSEHQAEAEQDALQQISLENIGTLDNPQGVKLYSRAMRMLGAKTPFILTGSIFFGIGIYFQSETGGLGIIFSVVGALAVLIGLWLAGKQLEAIITNGRVQVTRRWAGIRLSQTDYPFTGLQQLVLKEGARITANGKHTQMMALAIEHQGKLKTIVEGIQGRTPAEALKNVLIQKLIEANQSSKKAA